MTMLAETAQAVDEIVSSQFAVGRSLLATLQSENTALTNLDSEAIDAAGAAKLKQLGELEALEHDRAALLDMQAINPDDLTGLEAQGDLQSRWQELLKLLARCRSLNETNGALAASQRRHVEKALGLLYGTSAGAGTYNADGMAKSPAPSASIATA